MVTASERKAGHSGSYFWDHARLLLRTEPTCEVRITHKIVPLRFRVESCEGSEKTDRQ